MQNLLQEKARDLYRCKGVVAFAGTDDKPHGAADRESDAYTDRAAHDPAQRWADDVANDCAHAGSDGSTDGRADATAERRAIGGAVAQTDAHDGAAGDGCPPVRSDKARFSHEKALHPQPE